MAFVRPTTAAFVAGNTARFAALREPLALSFDDFIATSADSRHAPGVELLWRKCLAAGDLYRRAYRGRYCAGCEQFYEPSELDGGVCPARGASLRAGLSSSGNRPWVE